MGWGWIRELIAGIAKALKLILGMDKPVKRSGEHVQELPEKKNDDPPDLDLLP